MNFHQLTTFCTVLSEGSMTAAADKLFLTQPAVSQQIRALEEELSVPLLIRGVRQVRPTMQGQLLFDYAKRILHLTQQAEVAIQTISQEMSGNLRVGTTNSIGMYLISPIIGRLLKHNPQLNVKLVYGSLAQISASMKNHSIDMAIMPEVAQGFEEFDNQFLMKDDVWLVASGRDSSIPSKVSINDFPSRPIAIFSEMYQGFLDLLEKNCVENKVEFMPVFEADNVGTLKRVIESGLGWGFMPSHCIKKQVKTRRLVHVLVDEMKFSLGINMYTRKEQKLKQMSEVFFRALKQQVLSSS